MATGTSIFLIALGAVLTFAVEATVQGIDIAAVGVILMIAGAIGVAMSLLWIDRATAPRTRVVDSHRVVDGHPAEPARTTTVVEERRIEQPVAAEPTRVVPAPRPR